MLVFGQSNYVLLGEGRAVAAFHGGATLPA